jgi:fatty acid-binding protein DegV
VAVVGAPNIKNARTAKKTQFLRIAKTRKTAKNACFLKIDETQKLPKNQCLGFWRQNESQIAETEKNFLRLLGSQIDELAPAKQGAYLNPHVSHKKIPLSHEILVG